jgi:mannose-1-phosphate guanylyltransferase
MDLEGFWMDVGQPKDYLKGISLYLNSIKNTDKLTKNNQTEGNVLIHPTAKVHESAKLGPNVVIGENCVIEAGVRL